MALNPKTFLYELDTATSVATVTLNRPERLNALTFEVYEELRDFFYALDTEPGVRAIILTGSGRASTGRRRRGHHRCPARAGLPGPAGVRAAMGTSLPRAMSVVEVSGLVDEGAMVEIEATAVI